MRIHTLFAQQSLRREVEAFSSLVEQAELTAAYSTHLDFSEVGYWSSLAWNITAFNAVLTWMKLFKYMDVYPNMQVRA